MCETIKRKLCTKCKVEKELSFFHKDKTKKDGVTSRCNDCQKEYYLENKEKIARRKKEYYLDNMDAVTNYKKEYYLENKEKLAEQKKTNYLENKETVNLRNKEYRRANKAKIAEQKKQYGQTPKGKIVAINRSHKRRSLTKQGDITTAQLQELQQNAKTCYWCETSLKDKVVHIDHYIPLSKGGEHTFNNLVVCCSTCNLSKNAKDPIQFANSIGKLL